MVVQVNYGLKSGAYSSMGLGHQHAYTHRLYNSPVSALVRRTEKESSIYRFMDPFTPTVRPLVSCNDRSTHLLYVGHLSARDTP